MTQDMSNAPKTGIVHLGLGAFFRSHGAVYIQNAMKKDGGDWGVIGVSLRSPGMRDKLREQNWRYTAAEMGPEGLKTQDITVLNDVLVAPENPQAVLDAMADETVKIVSLTITEKGYCLASSDGAPDLNHPDIQHDIAHDMPKSALGYIVRALQHRRAAGLRPFTVMSLDNLPNNGAQIKAAVLSLASQINPDLAAWIESEARFPSTMVDRIVPATTDALIAQIADHTGEQDVAPVGHEPFSQWVIEDQFVDNNRPDFASVGAQFVQDVTAFEHMKLRMLNGTHSSLAYLGAVAGFRTVSEACENADIVNFLSHLWTAEIIPTLTSPEATDLPAYAEALLQRYQNPAIQHRLEQIAMDGSQKLPQRLLGTIQDNAKAGRSFDGLALAVAGWVRFLEGKDDNGNALSISDPLQDQLQELITTASTRDDLVTKLIGFKAVFSDPPAELAPALLAALAKLDDKGALAAMRETAR